MIFLTFTPCALGAGFLTKLILERIINMIDKSVLLRCGKCRTVNRVPVDKVNSSPKCGKCKSPLEFRRSPVDVHASNFDAEVLAWPGAVLVEFWAPWCGHCRAIAPAVDHLARERAGIVKVVKVNVDNERALGERFGIQATPMFFFYQQGKKLGDIAGGLPKEQLEAWIDSLLL